MVATVPADDDWRNLLRSSPRATTSLMRVFDPFGCKRTLAFSDRRNGGSAGSALIGPSLTTCSFRSLTRTFLVSRLGGRRFFRSFITYTFGGSGGLPGSGALLLGLGGLGGCRRCGLAYGVEGPRCSVNSDASRAGANPSQ